MSSLPIQHDEPAGPSRKGEPSTPPAADAPSVKGWKADDDYGTFDGETQRLAGRPFRSRGASLTAITSPRQLSRSLVSRIESDETKRILVEFSENDPENPFNYPTWRKVMIFGVMALQMFWVTGISAIYAGVATTVGDEFGLSALVARLPLSVFLIGFSIGPVFLTPLSEDYGRKPTYTCCLLALYLTQIGVARAQNIGTLIIVRLLGGIFGAPIFNSLCCIPDLWNPRHPLSGWFINGWAFVAESTTLSPLIAAAINHHLGWRWVFWIALIVGLGLEVLYVILVPETRQGPILAKRAKRLRRETGNNAYYAKHEVIGQRTMKEVLNETLIRPLRMLFSEPIVYVGAVFDGFNYAIVYLAIVSVDLIYAQYGFNDVQSYLVLLAFIVGYVCAIATYPLARRETARIERERGGECPEAKLWWVKYAGILFPISLYWIAATSRPPIPWIVSTIGFGCFALSSHIVFMVVSDYTVDSYGQYASSAVTGQSVAREVMVASFALVGVPFYENLGGPRYFWPTMILAFIATPMAAIPFIFDRFGPEIRRRSKFAMTLKTDRLLQKRPAELDHLDSPSSSAPQSRDPSTERHVARELPKSSVP